MNTMDAVKVMVSGQVAQLGERVERGMAVMCSDGVRVGMVAALLWDGAAHCVTDLLLCQLPTTAVYRQIPLALVERVAETAVYLTIPAANLPQLPAYEPPDPT
ncbi:MAG: DUF2171 domain-containing protein [Anaerolineales bacterium]|nr:DUF2171 domain-containing protein [Anaerolineales bacterium]